MPDPLIETARGVARCGAPPLWSADGRATVLSCIGCGRINTAQWCAATCGEYRLEIVPAAAHHAVAARLAVERRRADALGALTARLAAYVPGPDGPEPAYRALQVQARAVLRGLPAPEADGDGDGQADRLEVWACGCCGRVEAEAPCVEVCIDEPLEVVRGDVHDDVLAQLASVEARLRELTALVRQLAFVTPRAGGWEPSFRALQDHARRLVDAGPQ
jgi:hypothetical protein